ncbi:MAG: DNA primase [Ignavibacteriales bacterium]|nr:DNA primase [Ignavibacteriales bacterium]
MRIPPEKIEEIRNSVDIVDLIGSFIQLKKRGKNFVGSCPFHQEKTPSFSVSPERQMYHCFGCGVGGNAITFVMEYEKISFPEAVRSLAERVGITIPDYQSGEDIKTSEQEDLYNVCRIAGLFYYKSMTETGEGKFVLDYFGRRGFTDETIRIFGLGYSPNSWDALIKHSSEQNIDAAKLEKAGLARRKDDGSYHDYFRGRAMFPIFSSTGRVLGFGARKVREDDPLGKYINSPETLIYNKSKILYGLFQAKDDIRSKDFVILVEGYADLISVYQAGFRNVVASSGTALTVEQIQLISRYTKNIMVMYDADSAGSAAALRGVDLILENDLDVSVVALPAGEDPDSYINKNGSTAFQNLLDNAVSFVDFIAETFEKEGKFKTPEGQAQIVRSIIRTISKMKDELKRNFYIRSVAEKYKLYEATLYRELEKQTGQYKKTSFHFQNQDEEQVVPDSSSGSVSSSDSIPPAERDLLIAMLEGNVDIVRMAVDKIDQSEFQHTLARKLYCSIIDRWNSGKSTDPKDIVDELDNNDEIKLVSELLFNAYNLSKGWSDRGVNVTQGNPLKIAEDAITGMKRNGLERAIEENQRQLQNASRRSEDIIPFLEKHKQLSQELKNLDT